jgi:hypothetical protein
MRTSIFTTLLASSIFIIASCAGNSETKSEQAEVENLTPENKVTSGHTDFLDEILLGFEMSAIQKHMVQTPYTYLGEEKGRLNYEAQDENKVKHFISFADFNDNYLTSFTYNLLFEDNDTNLVSEYHAKIQAQLQAVYGDDFSTGYDASDLYVVDWYFEAGELILTMGIDFISVEVRQH